METESKGEKLFLFKLSDLGERKIRMQTTFLFRNLLVRLWNGLQQKSPVAVPVDVINSFSRIFNGDRTVRGLAESRGAQGNFLRTNLGV